MEFMGIAVGILALVGTSVLLFGRRGTLKILGGLLILAVLGISGTAGFLVWQDQHFQQKVRGFTEVTDPELLK